MDEMLKTVRRRVQPMPPWQSASPWPDRIAVTFKGDPATSFAVTWRTDASVAAARAQLALASDDARFDLAAQSFDAETQMLDLEAVPASADTPALIMRANDGLARVHYHAFTFAGLQPDTLYAYRVEGAEGLWGPWTQLRTAARDKPVKFLYFGDAQNAVYSHWSRVAQAGYAALPDADFAIHAGDLVNDGNRDREWAEWFAAGGALHTMVPIIPVAGNHEYGILISADGATRTRRLSPLWRPQFTLPVEADLPSGLAEEVYQVRYSRDVHIFVLSTQNTASLPLQAKWIDAALAASDAKWKIVTMHHPVFASADGRDSPGRRQLLLPVFEARKVALVLQGHDHSYARGVMPAAGPRARGRAGTMYVTSTSGPKHYPFKRDGWRGYSAQGEDIKLLRLAENTPLYQIIRIDGDDLTYEARMASGALYDDFTLNMDRKGRIALKDQSLSKDVPMRTFATTGAYEVPGN